MKILVLNLQGAEPKSLFEDERLENLRRFMDLGCFGELLGSNSKIPDWTVLAIQGDHTLTIWEFLQQAQKRCISIGHNEAHYINPAEIQAEITGQIILDADDPLKKSRSNFSILRNILENQTWDYCQLIDGGLEELRNISESDLAGTTLTDYYLHLDHEFEGVLQNLGDDTAVLVVSDASEGAQGCFILVSSNNPLRGEHKDGSGIDVAPTILELAGYPLPASIAGKSWVAGMELSDTPGSGLTAEEEEILRERLSGLGYI